MRSFSLTFFVVNLCADHLQSLFNVKICLLFAHHYIYDNMYIYICLFNLFVDNFTEFNTCFVMVLQATYVDLECIFWILCVLA